jgi:hypothetical protein
LIEIFQIARFTFDTARAHSLINGNERTEGLSEKSTRAKKNKQTIQVRRGETNLETCVVNCVGVNVKRERKKKKTSEQLAVRGQTEFLVFPKERRGAGGGAEPSPNWERERRLATPG